MSCRFHDSAGLTKGEGGVALTVKMPKRLRLATGVYRDAHGCSVIYHVAGMPKEVRFDPDTPLDRLLRWRKRAIADAAEEHPRDPRGSLARDVVRYLKRLKGQPGFKSE